MKRIGKTLRSYLKIITDLQNFSTKAHFRKHALEKLPRIRGKVNSVIFDINHEINIVLFHEIERVRFANAPDFFKR